VSVWCEQCGVRCAVCGVRWCGVWCVVCGVWCVVCVVVGCWVVGIEIGSTGGAAAVRALARERRAA
jgi:hypothetical protein